MNAKQDKIEWVQDYLPEGIIINIVTREENPLFCTGKDSVLIDDMRKIVSKWQELGGTGILYINPKEAVKDMKIIGIL